MQLLKQFEQKTPEIIFEWCDNETDAVGWLVIDSMKGNAAGGGTRMRKGLVKEEVISLAKTMGIKFSAIDFPIGGAKSGINFDPNDPRKNGVLKRWYRAITPMLKNYYGTGGDLNVDELREVIPITREHGVLHPQEGILKGYFGKSLDQKDLKKCLQQLQDGVSKVIENINYSPDITRKYTIADMITGYGVAKSVKHHYLNYGEEIAGKKVLVQGFGNVGSAAAFYLAKMGCDIIGIIEKQYVLEKAEGFSLDELKLLINSRYDAISPPSIDNAVLLDHVDKIWNVGADIFIPAAASRLVERKNIDQMLVCGLELISSGANIPFNDKELFYGPTCQYADERVSLLPDFVSNCGMAEVFKYLMRKGASISDEDIFKNVSDTIEKLIKKMYEKNKGRVGMTKTFLQMSLEKL